MVPSWKASLQAKDYQVTPEEAASNRYCLEVGIKVKKELRPSLENCWRSGIFNDDEWQQISDTLKLIENAGVPVALLDVKDPEQLIRLRRNAGLS
jgi:hypothetical protein